MKAAVYHEPGPPSVLRYEDVPDPVPGAGEVLVRVAAIGIQGGDTLSRAGAPVQHAPHIVGYQAAGTVAALGDGVTEFAAGDRVVAFMFAGSHAELAVARAGFTWKIPEGLGFEAAATVPVEFGTAEACLFPAGQLQAGETVVVLAGASGVGLAAVQLAKAAGATVIATASGPDERRERLRSYGADHVLDPAGDDVTAGILERCDEGADLVVDPVGGALGRAAIDALAYQGRIAFVGMAAREQNLIDPVRLMLKNASLAGVFLGGEMQRDMTRVHPVVASLLDRVAAGKLTAVVDRTFPLSDAAGAHAYVESRAAFGRVVIVPQSASNGAA